MFAELLDYRLSDLERLERLLAAIREARPREQEPSVGNEDRSVERD